MGEKLTNARVLALEPRTKRYQVRCSVLTGFLVRVSPSGVRTFYVDYRAGGRHRLYRLGRHGDAYTFTQAKQDAARVLAEVAAGNDPAQARGDRRTADAFTVGDLCARFIADRVTIKPSTREFYEHLIAKHLKSWRARPVESVTRSDVVRLHAKITKAGSPGAANKVVALLRNMYNRAGEWGLTNGPNPALHAPRNRPGRVGQALTPQQRKQLYAALSASEALHQFTQGYLPPGFCDAVRMLMVTGMRKSEVINLRWQWVKLDKRPRLELPDSKTGAKTVWLDASGVEILRRRARADEHPELVFSSPKGTSLEYNWCRRWPVLRDAAKLPKGFRTHDLRHAYISDAAMAGVSTEITMAMLGLTSPATAARYRHLADSAIADAVKKTAARVRPKKI